MRVLAIYQARKVAQQSLFERQHRLERLLAHAVPLAAHLRAWKPDPVVVHARHVAQVSVERDIEPFHAFERKCGLGVGDNHAASVNESLNAAEHCLRQRSVELGQQQHLVRVELAPQDILLGDEDVGEMRHPGRYRYLPDAVTMAHPLFGGEAIL